MREIALLTYGKKVTTLFLPEGFKPCSDDEVDNNICHTGCPFAYDDWDGTNCVFESHGEKCPFK